MNRQSKRELKRQMKQEMKERLAEVSYSPQEYERSIRGLVWWLNLLSIVWFIPLLISMIILSFKLIKVISQMNIEELLR